MSAQVGNLREQTPDRAKIPEGARPRATPLATGARLAAPCSEALRPAGHVACLCDTAVGMGSDQPLARGTRAALAAAVLVVAALATLLAVPAAGGVASGPTVREYDLGVRQLPQPLGGRFAQMPIRLWGAIGVPAGKGPFPVVIVGHGAAATGCPAKPDPQADASIWPCWDVAQRNDLGMRHLVRALAAAGFVAVAPDVNAAFTDGWGEPLETLRYGQVLDATAAELARANRGSASFGVPLRGRLDLSRLGAAGHSRGGWQVLRWAQPRERRTGTADVAAGRGRVSALLLVQGTYNEVEPASTRTVPMTVIVGQCDGDIGLQPARNYRRAESDPRRVAPIFKVLLHGANHAFFNTTWTALGRDDGAWAANTRPPCRQGTAHRGGATTVARAGRRRRVPPGVRHRHRALDAARRPVPPPAGGSARGGEPAVPPARGVVGSPSLAGSARATPGEGPAPAPPMR